MLISKKLSGWSSYKFYNTKVFSPNNQQELLEFLESSNDDMKIVARGHGCSFGDQAIYSEQDGVTIDLSRLNKIIELNRDNTVLKVQGGTKLNQILKFLLPKNLTLNSIPGGLEITVGGAISNNVHGKDCWKNGYFEENIKSVLILDCNGNIKKLSKNQNKEYFDYIFGSIGLMGVIVEVELLVKKIPSQYLTTKTIKVNNIEKMEECFENLDDKSEFAVAWLDCFAKNKNSMRGIFQKASFQNSLNNEKIIADPKFFKDPKDLKIFGILPIRSFWAIIKIFFNTKIFKIINPLVFHLSFLLKKEKIIPYVEFLMFETKYLPSYKTWFEPDGFLCIQPFFTKENAFKKIQSVIELCQFYGIVPFWCPIKKYKSKIINPLDFASEEGGYSIVIDFFPKEHNKQKIEEFILELENLVFEQGGKFYLSKDQIMSKEFFRKTYPDLNRFIKIKNEFDPKNKFLSNQYLRLIN